MLTDKDTTEQIVGEAFADHKPSPSGLLDSINWQPDLNPVRFLISQVSNSNL